MDTATPRPPGFRLEFSWQALLKIMAAVLLAYVLVRLWPFLQLFTIAILIAVPLYRIVAWGCRRGWPRWVGLTLSSLTLILLVGGFFGLIGPAVYRQASNVVKDFPKLKQEILSRVPASGPLRDGVEALSRPGALPVSQKWMQGALNAAKTTLAGIFDLLVVIVLSIYLMSDGERALAWLINFFPAQRRPRVAEGLRAIGQRIVAYTVGQFITSALCGSYVFILLSLLHVPMALLLAVMAAVFDILPVIGFILTVLPAVGMALTVSPGTALLVLGLYTAYHFFEDYFIIPKVYGKQLRLSNLAVLLSISVGGVLAGVFGAVAILPFVAAYPALERLWLARQLEPEVIKDHEKQLRAA